MGWLWWVLIAVLLGGVVWWLVNRSQDEPAYDGTASGSSGSREEKTGGSGDLDGAAAGAGAAGAGAAGAGAAGAGVAGAGVAGAAVVGRDDAPAGGAAPAAETAPEAAAAPRHAAPVADDATAAPSADLDPAAAGVPAPNESADPGTPETTGAAPDDAGWAPAEAASAPTGDLADASWPTTADLAAAEADVEVPSDAAPAATAPSAAASAGETSASDTSAAEDAGWAPVGSSDAPADAAAPAAPAAPAEGAWAQDQSDVTAEGETLVVSEASGAAAEDVAPEAVSPEAVSPTASEDSATTVDESGWTPGQQVTESLPTDQPPAEDSGDEGTGAGTVEAPVVSEASGAAAADVAPASTAAGDAPAGDSAEVPGHQVTAIFRDDQPGSYGVGDDEPAGTPASSAPGSASPGSASPVDEVQSGSSDLEFADASVAYEEPASDPSYTPTHLAPTATDTSVDPSASPETTPAPETGAGEGFGGAAVGGTPEVSEGRYGPGSAEPTADGGAPGAAYTIKGNVDSMRFHGPESPYYNRTTAEVWFTDAEAARRAGFIPWNEI